MRKAATLLLIAAVMTGCGSTQTKRYFQIKTIAVEEPALPRVERRLQVEPAAVDPLYDDIRILYRVSPFEVKYYPYEFWAEKPGKLAADSMAAFLVVKKVFPAVQRGVAGLAKEPPDLLLRSRVRVLEEIDSPNAWQARLAMDLEFVDAKTGKAVASASFDRKESMARQVGSLPAVVSGILDDELGKLVWELARALEKK
jgi:ABC-type uncharacterized transport system auxiliary subunit